MTRKEAQSRRAAFGGHKPLTPGTRIRVTTVCRRFECVVAATYRVTTGPMVPVCGAPLGVQEVPRAKCEVIG